MYKNGRSKFKSFKANAQKESIPEEMKMANAEAKSGEIKTHLERMQQKMRLTSKCKEYFSIRENLDPMDKSEIRRLWKLIRGILIRKSILAKKQQTQEIDTRIKVASINQSIRLIKTSHVGQLKQLKLDLQEEAACLHLLKTLAKDSESGKLGKWARVDEEADARRFLAEEVVRKLRELATKKQKITVQIIRATKESFKLNFKVEENSK